MLKDRRSKREDLVRGTLLLLAFSANLSNRSSLASILSNSPGTALSAERRRKRRKERRATTRRADATRRKPRTRPKTRSQKCPLQTEETRERNMERSSLRSSWATSSAGAGVVTVFETTSMTVGV